MEQNNEMIQLPLFGLPELDGTHEAILYTSYPRVYEQMGGHDRPNFFIAIETEGSMCVCILTQIRYSLDNKICLDRCKIKTLHARDGQTARIRRIELKPISSLTLSAPCEITQKDKLALRGKPLVPGEQTLLFTLSGQARSLRIEQMDAPSGYIDETTKITVHRIHDANGIPVGYDDIGGLDREIRQIRESVEWPLRHPEHFEYLGVPHPKGVLLYGPPGTGKTLIAKALASQIGAQIFSINGPEIYSKWYGESEASLRRVFEQAQKCAPSIIVIDELDALAPARKGHGEAEHRVVATLLTLMDGMKAMRGVVVIGTTNRVNAIDPALRREGRFSIEINIGAPDVAGRRKILEIHTRRMPLSDDVDLDCLAMRTVGFVGADIVSLCREAAFCSVRQARGQNISEWFSGTHLKICQSHFVEALKKVRPSALREFYVDIPETSWDDVGGLEEIKKIIIENITYAITRSDAYRKAGVRPARGILLYGPPGTGKTLLAKAAARQSGANFIAIRGPEIRSKWFGESEERLREIFQKARESAPCIVFFDEIDALAPARGEGSQTTDSIVNQLLAEIDGIQPSNGIVVMGATNRHHLLDPALLRPGRFDYQIEVPLPDWTARRQILKIHLKDKPLSDDFNENEFEQLTEHFSGADLAEMCRQAGMTALRRANFSSDAILITQKDLIDAAIYIAKTTEDLKPRPFGFSQKN